MQQGVSVPTRQIPCVLLSAAQPVQVRYWSLWDRLCFLLLG